MVRQMINLHLKRGDLVLSKEYGTGTVIKFLGKQYDYPIEVKEECRKLRAKNFQK